MGYLPSATSMVVLEGGSRTVDVHATARLDLVALVLAGVLITLAAWDWLKRRD